jgi:hypothetical protein
MQVSYEQFIEDNCHFLNQVQRCYLQMRESEVRAEHIRATLKSLYTTMVQKSNDLKVLSPAHLPYKKAAAFI